MNTAPPLILVVDDEDDLRDSVADLLREEGFDVRGARNGQDALALLQELPHCSLVLLDLMMPGMNGYEFIDALPSSPPPPPVLLVTAFPEGAPPSQLVLGKPFDIDVLLARVRSLIPRPATPVAG